MREDEAHRSFTAYLLVGLATIGLILAFCGVTMGFPATALSGGLLMLVVLLIWQFRPARYD